jgi:glycosidase
VSKKYQPQPYSKVKHPSWSKDAVIYQINTRQFTPEGTFAAAQRELPRLRELGVDILWLMPIHPIGVLNRKGGLGSPYAVKDYLDVNPEFGDKKDFKAFVDAAHAQGFKVILDWVANHTGWDNDLHQDHPDWYAKDWKGDFQPTPWWDWSDVIDLDFSNPALRKYMTKALKYWVKEFDVDGYRCDVAGLVPTDFWNNARKELDRIKPVFMLAEWESKDLHEYAFDMTYAWSWWESVANICEGKADTGALNVYYAWNEKHWPAEAMRMVHTSNHDKNSWEGTEFERFGAGVKTAIAFSFISEGMPLIYNGQEAGNEKRLEFFEKDPIVWKDHEHNELFKTLIQIKKRNRALWNAQFGGRMHQVLNSQPERVFSFVREKNDNKIFAIFNFSAEDREVTFPTGIHHGEYRDSFTGDPVHFSEMDSISLPAWGFRVFEK